MSTPDLRTDAEVICEFMEPKPIKWLHDSTRSIGGWWVRERANVAGAVYSGPAREAISAMNDRAKLGAMHEVESRLTEEQYCRYDRVLEKAARARSKESDVVIDVFVWHASAQVKIVALATVLRK